MTGRLLHVSFAQINPNACGHVISKVDNKLYEVFRHREHVQNYVPVCLFVGRLTSALGSQHGNAFAAAI